MKEGVPGRPDIPYVQTFHALKEVGHRHQCKTLGSLLTHSVELEVVKIGEFDVNTDSTAV
eukprot:3231738-Amphidinium_carterae.1